MTDSWTVQACGSWRTASDLPTAVVLAASPEQLPPGLPSYVTRDRLRSAQNCKVSFFVEAMRRRPCGTILIANDSDHFVFWNDPLLSAEAVRCVIAEATKRQRDGYVDRGRGIDLEWLRRWGAEVSQSRY